MMTTDDRSKKLKVRAAALLLLACAAIHSQFPALNSPTNTNGELLGLRKLLKDDESSSVLFNDNNPHEGWCPDAKCTNSPVCYPCDRRFLIEIATKRSGSTSLMHMLDKLPGVRMGGENNNALHKIANLFKGLPLTGPASSEAWKRGRILEQDMACTAQKVIEAINPPLQREQEAGFDDSSTIIGWKTVRFHEDWDRIEDAVQFVKRYFPCARVVINIRSDTFNQAVSQMRNLKWWDREEKEKLDETNALMKDVAKMFGPKQAYFLDSSEWTKENGHDQINGLIEWLGFEDCKFEKIPHWNANGYDSDDTTVVDLGSNCHFALE